MKIRISPLMIPMIAVIYLSGNTNLYILTYAVMTLHEAAHMLAAICIGLKVQSITFSPFGVNLKLKNKIISSVTDEIILYCAGPLVNGTLAIVALALKDYTLYRLNSVLMVMNLLPVIPLDGGMISMRLLSYCVGQKGAKKILKTITGVMSVSFLLLALLGWYKGYISISMFIISALMLGNLLTAGEMCDIDYINMLSCRKKKTNKIRCVFLDDKNTLQGITNSFSPLVNTVVFVKDADGKITELLTEDEIMHKIGIYEN